MANGMPVPDAPTSETECMSSTKASRKEVTRLAKAAQRAKRDGTQPYGQKPCVICACHVDLLVRCQYRGDGTWAMVCGRCWRTPAVSGGVVDGDGSNANYRYGGLWKNLHATPLMKQLGAGPPAKIGVYDERSATELLDVSSTPAVETDCAPSVPVKSSQISERQRRIAATTLTVTSLEKMGYSWDQNEHTVRIYLPVCNISPDQLHVTFSARGCSLVVQVKGHRSFFEVQPNTLFAEIDPTLSAVKVPRSRQHVTLCLHKLDPDVEWVTLRGKR